MKGKPFKRTTGGSCMKLTITGRKFTVTDRLTERITEKLAKFDKYFDDEATGTVVLRSRKNAEIIEVKSLDNDSTVKLFYKLICE